MFDEIIKSCSFLLREYPEAEYCREYLNSRISEKSQSEYEFGYFPPIDNIKSLTSIIGEDELKNNKLMFSKTIEDSLFPRIAYFSYFEDHPLIMPFKNQYGKIVAIIGRSLLSEEERKEKGISKYKNTIFTKSNYLFGLYQNKKHILENNMVYIVEGQFDVIKSSENILQNIVCVGGSSMSSYQFSLITRYTNNLVLLFDNDDAGDSGRKLIMSKYKQYANINNFYIPEEYKDIDEFFQNNSSDDLRFVIKK